MAETETLTIFLETRPRRDVGMSRDRIENETSRPRHNPGDEKGEGRESQCTTVASITYNKQSQVFLIYEKKHLCGKVHCKRDHPLCSTSACEGKIARPTLTGSVNNQHL